MFAVLSEDDLVAASSRLTLRRARADAAMQPRAVDTTLSGVTLTWADAVCEFPAGAGLAGSSCTCPARRFCRHRVRSVLFLQRTAAAEEDDWSVADIPRALINRSAGRVLMRQAEAALHDGLAVRAESKTAVVIPALGVRVRFLPRQPLAAALCSCGSREVCVHRLIAALHFQPPGQRPTRPPAPDEEALTARARQSASELLTRGLDGTPLAAAEGLAALSQRLSTALPAPADDLSRLSHQLSDYHRRSARFTPRGWLLGVGRLLARLTALEAEDRTRPAELLRGQGRRSRLAATNLDLIGLGAEGFVGARGSVVKCWFVLEQTGDVVSATVGRGVIDGEVASPASLWWQPMWGMASPAEVAHARLRLPTARLSPDGTLGGAKGPVQRHPAPASPADLPPTLCADGVAALRAMWAKLPPPLLRAPSQTGVPAVVQLARPPGPPHFSPVSQKLTLPAALADGSPLRLEIPHGPATRRTIAVCERVRAWQGEPTHLLVRFWPTPTGFTAAPISAWLRGVDGPVSLGLGDTPLRRAAGPDPQQPPPPRPAEPLPLARLRELLALLETMAIGGIGRAHHTAPLHRAAAGLADLGLTAAAQATATLAEHPDPVAFVRLLAWASTAEEAWALRE